MQSKEQFNGEISFTYKYLLHLPPSYDADTGSEFALVLYLHGAGERGEDLRLLRRHGPPKFLDEQDDFPAIVVSPQCPEGEWWDTLKLKTLLDGILATKRVDRSRVYVTGNSMGGYGTWEMGQKFPDMFAALAPICGGGNPFRNSRHLRKMPIWVFHGMKDSIVPFEESLTLVRALERTGANIKFTVYPEAEHDSWTETYENPEFWAWLLAQKRPVDSD